MIEIGLAEYFGMAEAMGIIGTMFVVLYSPENKHRNCLKILKLRS
jgi:hypothetical protein